MSGSARRLAEVAMSESDETAPFTCQRTDNWVHTSPAASEADKESDLHMAPFRAVIPILELNLSEQQESVDVGVDGRPLRRGLLHALPQPVLDEQGMPECLGDGLGENQEQAQALFALGHETKAQRLACCGRFARRVECPSGHPFLIRFMCGLRFCRNCAARVFLELFERNVGLERLIVRRRGWVFARLDFTLRNTGQMPDGESIRAMNCAVRRVLRRLLRGKNGWGFLWCDEFGWQNTNLHCHGLYYGPYIPQAQLAQEWLHETGNSQIVSIKSVRWNFRHALRRLLGYLSKPAADDPKHLAQLEAAFSGVRRVHALGLFYNPDLPEQDAFAREKESNCPYCGGYLFGVGSYCSMTVFAGSGVPDLDTARRDVARRRVYGRAGPI